MEDGVGGVRKGVWGGWGGGTGLARGGWRMYRRGVVKKLHAV